MKKIKVLIGVILIFSIQTFSENNTSDKIINFLKTQMP